jgi:hypothetical protein
VKTLAPIIVGKYTFQATAEHVGDAVVAVTVKLPYRDRPASLTRKMNHQGTHNHTVEQFEKDVNDFAARLAAELAGRIRSSELAANFAKV